MERQQKRAQLQQVQWQHYSVQSQPQYIAMTCMPEFGAVNPRFRAPGARGTASPSTAATRPDSHNDGLKVDLLGNGGSNSFEEVEQTSTDDGEEELHECTDESDSDDHSVLSGPSSTGQTTLMIRNVQGLEANLAQLKKKRVHWQSHFVIAPKDRDYQSRLEARTALVSIAEKEQAISAMIGLLEDSNYQVRIEAMTALVSIADKEQAIPAVIGRLKDPDGDVCLAAAGVLKNMGEPVEPQKIKVFDELKKLKDSDNDVRMAAVKALADIVEKGGQVYEALTLSMMEDDDYRVRVQAMTVLVSIAEKEQAISMVIGRLEDGDEDVLEIAVKALAEIAEKGDQVSCEALISCMTEDRNNQVRLEARTALVSIAEKDQAISAVISRLEDDDPDVKHAAAKTLSEIAEKGDRSCCEALILRITKESRPSGRPTIGDAVRVKERRGRIVNYDSGVEVYMG